MHQVCTCKTSPTTWCPHHHPEQHKAQDPFPVRYTKADWALLDEARELIDRLTAPSSRNAGLIQQIEAGVFDKTDI